MNGILRDLYIKAKPKEALVSQEQYKSADVLLGSEVEKFAESIVRECVAALWTEECRTSDLASEEYIRGSNKIKQHFGVEE